MRALSSLVKEYDPRDPLVRVVCGLLDAGLIVATRDPSGRFVQMSDVYGDALGHESDVRGGGFISGERYFDPAGRELTRSEHPAVVARMSGVPQRNRILGVRSPNGHEFWFQASYMPLEQSPEGWSVLTVGIALERGAFAPPEVTGETYAEPILAFAEAVAGRRLGPALLAAALRDPVDAVIADGAGARLAWRRGDWIELEPLRARPDETATPRVRYAGESARRWEMRETYYAPNLRDTDVVGSRVAVEYDNPIRSYALVPVPNLAGDRVASIAVTHPEPGALLSEQICALERLARLAGAAFDPPAA